VWGEVTRKGTRRGGGGRERKKRRTGHVDRSRGIDPDPHCQRVS
jgi:hypothetical protein